MEGNKEEVKDSSYLMGYNDIPVVACKYCNSLNIQEDDNGNDLCMRCSSINEIKHYKTIHEYLKEYEKR